MSRCQGEKAPRLGVGGRRRVVAVTQVVVPPQGAGVLPIELAALQSFMSWC